MKIAVFSDIHDNIWNLQRVLKLIKGKVKVIIFCGDLCAPSTSAILASANIPTYLCLGNVDEDHIGMYKMGGKKFTWFNLSQEYGEVTLDKRKIAFCHYPRLAELLAKTGNFDAVFHGHTHISRVTKTDQALLVNPGAICGFKGSKTIQPSYVIYDTKTNSVKLINVK